MRDKILSLLIGGSIGIIIAMTLWRSWIDLPTARKNNVQLQNKVESLEDVLRYRETELHECLNNIDSLKIQSFILEGVDYDRSKILVGKNQ